MFKNIKILSRKQVEEIISSQIMPTCLPWALISIWNSFELVHVFTREILKKIGCQEALSIRFGDLTLDELSRKKKEEKDKEKLFNESDAEQIILFIDEINKVDVPVLIIHCAAGISRSGAIGLFACRYLKLDEKTFLNSNKHILPNFYILEILNKVSGTNDDYVKFWKTEENLKKREAMFKFSDKKG
jgi:predicted protein tyrosine phosphatase